MNTAELTNLLLSLDSTHTDAVRRLLDSRLMAHRRGEVHYPAFEGLAQLTDNERYLLIREIPDTTLAEALKAGSEYLRWAVRIVCTKTRKELIARTMRRLGPTRLSVAERAIDAVLAELGSQRESGIITPALTDGETEQGLNAIRAGLPGGTAPQLQMPAETSEYLHEHLCGAQDQTLARVVEHADPSDLALLLLQGRSVLLTERLLTVGACVPARVVRCRACTASRRRTARAWMPGTSPLANNDL